MTPRRSDDTTRLAAELRFVSLGSGRSISKSRLFDVFQVGGWTAAYGVCALAAEPGQGLWPSLFNTLIWAICGALVTLISHRIYRRSRRLDHSHLRIAVIALTSSVLFAPLWYFMEHVVLRASLPRVLTLDLLRPVFSSDAAIMAREPLLLTRYLWPFYAVILFTWACLYFGINAILDLEAERAAVINARKLADTARLRSLQSNLNPHFLFNTLNGIATLVREQDSRGAAAMLDALGLFLRATLQRVDTPEIRVAEEIDLIGQYLCIQRYRFGVRLHAVVDAKRETFDAVIPTLILQPLVENAVRYSVLPRDEGGSLWVAIRKELATLVVSVTDDGPGIRAGAENAFGLGLQNSSDRLTALYGAAADLTIGNRSDGTGCVVVIRLPFRLVAVSQPCSSAIAAARA